MNWETIIIAAVAGLGPAVIALLPVYWKMKQDIEARKQEAEEKKIAAVKEDTDVTRQAMVLLISQLTERNKKLEDDNEELEEKFDAERQRRRDTEDKLDECLKQK